MNFQVQINTCRVCMKTDPEESLLKDIDLQRKFEFTTRLQLHTNDNMPSLICSKCVLRLLVAYDFIKLSHKSDKDLKTFLNKISNDFEMVTKTHTFNRSSVSGGSNTGVLQKPEDDDELLLLVANENVQSMTTDVGDGKESVSSTKTAEYAPLQERQLKIKERFLNAQGREELLEADTYELFEDTNFSESNAINAKSESLKDMHGLKADEVEGEECNFQTEIEVLEECTIEESNTEGQRHMMDAQFSVLNESYNEEYDSMIVEQEAVSSDVECVSESGLEGSAAENDDTELYEHADELTQEPQEEVNMPTETLAEVESSNVVAAESPLLTANISLPNTGPENVGTKSSNKSTRRAPGSRATARSRKSVSPSFNTRFYCVKCNRDFSTKTNLTRHMAIHEGSKPYQCNVCNKSFTQNGSLKQHMLIHTGEKPYVCKYCNRGFSQCKSLVFHLRRHTGDKPFQCETCGMFFRQKDGLKTHILKRHMYFTRDSGTHVCYICKKSIQTKQALQEHMRKHVNNRKNVTVLGAGVSTSAPGMHHNAEVMLELLDENEFLGEKTTLLHDELPLADDEVPTHVVDITAASTDEPSRAKKYQCRKCFKCFAIKKNLIRHLSIHDVSVAELFQCTLCEIAFDSNHALKVHRVREHRETGVNLNECEECQIIFQNIRELNTHNSLTHGLTCSYCPNLSFKSQKSLMDHMLEHELNDIDTN